MENLVCMKLLLNFHGEELHQILIRRITYGDGKGRECRKGDLFFSHFVLLGSPPVFFYAIKSDLNSPSLS